MHAVVVDFAFLQCGDGAIVEGGATILVGVWENHVFGDKSFFSKLADCLLPLSIAPNELKPMRSGLGRSGAQPIALATA